MIDYAELEQQVYQTLRHHAFENRGSLPPPQLKRIAGTIIDILLDRSDDSAAAIAELTHRGLALRSIIEAGATVQRVVAASGDVSQIGSISRHLADLLIATHEYEIEVVRAEQEKLRAAVSVALQEQQIEARRLSDLIHELSTPVVPVYDGILVLPLIGAIDSRRSQDITDKLLDNISRLHAHTIIIDITGVSVVDTSVAEHLLQTAQAASLLGASVVLVGISPEIAQTIVQLGIEITHMATLSDLQAGIAHALRRRGLAVQPLESRS